MLRWLLNLLRRRRHEEMTMAQFWIGRHERALGDAEWRR
jgi:hypothetical protein